MTHIATTSQLRIELLDERAIRQIEPAQWDELAANSWVSNPFYARDYIQAGLNTIDRDTGLQAVTIRDAQDGRLLGLFPFRVRRFPVPRALGATNLYQFCGQPLVHRDHAHDVLDAWIEALGNRRIPRRWSFPHLDLSSPFAKRLEHIGMVGALACLPLVNYRRAQLTRASDSFRAHVEETLSKSRAKDIQRTLRRLKELGEVRFERATTAKLVADRIEQFLAIEHAGWKGAAGTSFLANPEHADFARQAFGSGSSLASVDSLLLDGEPIALSINIRSGATIFTPKCAYNESFRKYSPGLVLEYLVVEAFYSSVDCTDMDAATTTDNHVVEGLWNCNKPMGTLVVGPQSWATHWLAQFHTACRAGKHKIKALEAGAAGPLINVARSLRRRVGRINSEILLGSSCLLHTAETVLPRLI